jgi:hypothetical protein
MLFVLVVSWVVTLLLVRLMVKTEFKSRTLAVPGRLVFCMIALIGVVFDLLVVLALRRFLTEDLNSMVRAHVLLVIWWFVFQFITYYFFARADYNRHVKRLLAATICS